MPDSFTKTVHTSYGKNIKNSIGGMLLGLILFLGSFVLLWWNEGNSVKLIKQEKYIKANAITVDVDRPDRENDNKIIAVSGKLLTNESLADENINMEKALVLKRDVEMYQWDEEKSEKTKDNLGGSSDTTTTYTYTQKWSTRKIDSSRFEVQQGHINPDFPISSLRLNQPSAVFGRYMANELQTGNINDLAPITNLPQSNMYQVFDGKYYSIEASPSAPRVGDIRISYSYAPSGSEISLFGLQNPNNTISPFALDGERLYWQEDGIFDKNTMLKHMKDFHSMLTNILRLVGWVMMYIGLLLISAPIKAIAKIIPALGTLAGFLSGLIMFIISIILSLITIAIAWFAYRPFFSILLIIIVGVVIYLSKDIIKKKKQEIVINE